jgi:hypothetical protein
MEKRKLAQRRNYAKWLLLGGNFNSLRQYKDVLTKEECALLDSVFRVRIAISKNWDNSSKSLGLNPIPETHCIECGVVIKSRVKNKPRCKLCVE